MQVKCLAGKLDEVQDWLARAVRNGTELPLSVQVLDKVPTRVGGSWNFAYYLEAQLPLMQAWDPGAVAHSIPAKLYFAMPGRTTAAVGSVSGYDSAEQASNALGAGVLELAHRERIKSQKIPTAAEVSAMLEPSPGVELRGTSRETPELAGQLATLAAALKARGMVIRPSPPEELLEYVRRVARPPHVEAGLSAAIMRLLDILTGPVNAAAAPSEGVIPCC